MNFNTAKTSSLAVPLALAALFIIVRPASAQSAPQSARASLVLQYDGGEITVPAATVAGWQGTYSLSRGSLLLPPRVPLDLRIRQAFSAVRPVSAGLHYYTYNPAAVYDWVSQLKPTIDQSAQSGSMTISGQRVRDFLPPQPGRNLNIYDSAFNLVDALESSQATAQLAVTTTYASGPGLDASNSLGIKELIAHGESNFSGSPANRRHNIAAGMSKFKGLIIAPGDEFSFNKYLGNVDAGTGFLPELVIKQNNTVKEYGGGICQVSTTMFRSIMASGMRITQRKNHSYAVRYYAPQGTDATTYSGSVDFRWVNDTPASVLIWSYFKDNNTLVFDLYGTKDDRQVTISPPVQFDRKPDGSMKAAWQRLVTLAGKTRTDIFRSTYQPAALFHKVEQFVPSSPADQTPGAPNSTPPPAETPAPSANTNNSAAPPPANPPSNNPPAI